MTPPASAAPDPLSGRTLGDFLVQELIGGGGFGVVYRAEQRLLKRDAVIKVLRRGHRSDPAVIQRFLREAQLASALDHPFAAHIYAFGAETDGVLWIAMERVRGTPLDQMLKAGGPLPIERFVPLFTRICEVVQSAHERNIVHRDLKPANVMVLTRSGLLLPKLLDFGIAKQLGEDGAEIDLDALSSSDEHAPGDLASSDPKITSEGAVVGSPHYMAPEQWVNRDVGPHTDLYALGVIAYEALTGRAPFEGRDVMAIARGHCKKPVPALGPGFPPALDGVLARAMAKRPADRFESALDLAAELQAASGLHGEPLGLPQLDEPVREALLASAPQPLAEAVAALDAARSLHQARDAVWQIFHVAVRLIGLYAISAHSRGGGPVGDAAELLRALRRRALTDPEWLTLTGTLLAPHRSRRDAYPVPELIGLFFDVDGAPLSDGPLDAFVELLAESETAALEEEVRRHLQRAVPILSTALRRLAFLASYPLVVSRGGVVERWMGVRRPRRQPVTPRGAGLPEGVVALLSDDGAPVLLLSPLVQVAPPSPGAPDELFLLDGPGRRGGRLLSLPTAFEHADAELWEWYRRALGAVGDEAEGTVGAERAPYVGLAAFSSADTEMFFGRDREVEAAINRLRAASFLAVVGPSGAGKSSFVHAGVAAALPAGSRVLSMRPGARPYEALAARLQHAAPHLKADLLAASPEAIAVALATLPVADGAWTVLVVDQFEELFTLTSDADERARFATALVRAARGAEAPVRVVLTLRDDFLMRAQALAPLRDALAAGLTLLGTPAAEDLRRILVEPARRVGYELDDPKLADEVIAQVHHLPAALPLLSFTALRLWEMRDRHFHQLTRRAYESMGGVGGALARHAEEMLTGLGAEQQRLVREAFRHLVTAEGTRAVLTRDELVQVLAGGARAEAVIDRLIESRLVVASEAEQGTAQIEIAHEALIAAWPRLVRWRTEDAEGARLRDQLRAAVRQWEQRGRPRGLLWRDEALAEYELWRARHAQPLTDAEEAFARESVAQTRSGKRLRRQLVVGVIAMLAIGLFVLFRSDRRSRLNEAEARQRLATNYTEQGRSLLLGGDALRALLYLAEAARLGHDSFDLRVLGAIAEQAIAQQLRVLHASSGELWNARFSPDASRVLTYAPDGEVRLLEADSGRVVFTFHHPGVRDADYSPDGRLAATHGEHDVQVWDLQTGQRRYVLEGVWCADDDLHKPAEVRFSTDGALLFGASPDGAVRAWAAADGSTVRVMRGHTGHVLSLEVIAVDLVVTAGTDGTARLWDPRTGAARAVLRAPADEPLLFATADRSGRRVLAGATGMARVWDVASGRQLAQLPQHHRVLQGAFTPDGARFVLRLDADPQIQVWDAQGGSMSPLSTHASVADIAVSPDGRQLVSAGFDGVARLFDIEHAAPIAELSGHTGKLWHGSWARDGARVLTAGIDGSARIWRATPAGLDLAIPGGVTTMVRVTRDGKRVLAASLNGELEAYDAGTGRLVEKRPPPAGLKGEAFLFWGDDSRGLSTVDNEVSLWAGDGRRLVGPLRVPHSPDAALLSADGSLIVAGLRDGAIWVWRVADGKRLRVLEGHTGAITNLAFSPAGDLLASVSHDQTARLWRLVGDAPARVLRGHGGLVASADFSPDGSVLVTSGDDETVRTWRVADGTPLGVWRGHSGQLLVARFSHDGRLVASTGADGLRVWSAVTGKQLFVREGANMVDASFSQDDRAVLTAEPFGVRRWRLPGGDAPATDLPARSRCLVPYRLVGDAVLPAELPADCTK